jgi:hypothetical protein
MATGNRKKPANRTSRGPAARTASAAKAGAPIKTSAAKATSARPGGKGKVSDTTGPEDSGSASKRLFDLRWLIAGMFVVYGIILSITGILDSQAEINKAAGVRINLWTGIGMFVVGLVFAAWARWRPLRPE